jgi:small subunit ribosomal protein S17
MAEDEKDQQPTEAEAPAAEEPAAETPAAEPAAAAPPSAEEAAPAARLSPKERRRLARSTATGPGAPPRSLEDRLRERAEGRARKAKERTRWRAKRKARDSERNRDSVSRITDGQQDSPSAPQESVARKTRQGVVVSNKADKTITVRIDRVARHRVYGKVMRETGTLHAHDERNEANEGDVVRVGESRPLSRTKRWRLLEVLEKAR